DKGLVKLMDLGEYWEQSTGAPIPLGGIIVKRDVDKSIQQKIDDLIKQSVAYSFKNYPVISSYVSSHSQEMSEDVMRKHIDLYVNHFTLGLGEEGRQAVHTFLKVYASIHRTNISFEGIFANEEVQIY
ncbi:MAG: 1,4-dihydroxy-6-naphthoate synthase, partial [Bacteroidota bacterium]|nr:1,4-dihydroxy-6-naphthoate synthase [Bacteroidota bacterium]